MTTRPWVEIGAVLRSRRVELGLTQLQLAARAGVSEVTVRILETGRRENYRAANLRAIAGAVDWPSDAFERLAAGLPAVDPDADETSGGRDGTISERVARLEAEIVRLRDELAAARQRI